MNDKYELLETMEFGGYGIVWKARKVSAPEDLMIKQVPKSPYSRNEIDLMQQFNHPSLMRALDVYENTLDYFIVMEDGSPDLQRLIESGIQFAESLPSIMKSLLEGVAYMHSLGIGHFDLKPSNILCKGTKIGDFGLCRNLDDLEESSIITTPNYMPLDCLLGGDPSRAFDIWSLGCIMGELMTGSILFKGESQLEVIGSIVRVLGNPKVEEWPERASIDYFKHFDLPNHEPSLKELIPSSYPKEAIDLLEKMLTVSSGKRPSAQELLSHPYLAA